MVYKFINKLLKSSDSADADMENLCLTLLNLEEIEEDRLEAWIELAIFRPLSLEEDPQQQQQQQQQQQLQQQQPEEQQTVI